METKSVASRAPHATDNVYVGRFAPSPTGPLHLGSLIAATASYLEAKVHQGRWLVRMEDIDRQRERPGAAATILKTLEQFGFEWDDIPLFQHRREMAYQRALERLNAAGLTYRCSCSRREIADHAIAGVEGPVYPGTCRGRQINLGRKTAVRIRTDDRTLRITDLLQGQVEQRLDRDVGDFILRRADGCWAYQLAVVVDDAFQQITHIVRGTDLLASTPRQVYLQTLLGLPTPEYMHIPIAVNSKNKKLGKGTGAGALDLRHPSTTLCQVLRFLNQPVPAELAAGSLSTVWSWALQHWSSDPLKGIHKQKVAETNS